MVSIKHRASENLVKTDQNVDSGKRSYHRGMVSYSRQLKPQYLSTPMQPETGCALWAKRQNVSVLDQTGTICLAKLVAILICRSLDTFQTTRQARPGALSRDTHVVSGRRHSLPFVPIVRPPTPNISIAVCQVVSAHAT